MGFSVQGLGDEIWVLGVQKVLDPEVACPGILLLFGVWGSGFTVQGSAFMNWGACERVSG